MSLDAEITGEGRGAKVVLVNNENAGQGPLNADLPEMFEDEFSLLAAAFESNPMDEDGGLRAEVIEEDFLPLIDWFEDNFLSDQPAFAKLAALKDARIKAEGVG